MRQVLKGSVLLASAVVSVGVVAGCGNDSSSPTGAGTTGAGASTSSTAVVSAAAGDPAKVKGLLLTAAQVPAGYAIVPIPESQIQQSLDQVVDSLHGATVTPAGCANLQKLPTVSASKVGLLVATSQSKGALSETLTAIPTDIAEARTKATGDCKSFEIDFTSGPAAGSKASATTTVLTPPATQVDADDVLILRQEVSVTNGGRNTPVTTLTGSASVKGYTVSATANGLSHEPDQAAFEKFFAAAVNRVAAQA